jgi:ATP-dependent Clp protease ATP-binding subunit ClpA
MDAANILKTLARGELRAIGATTWMNIKIFRKRQSARKTFSENNYRRTRY